MKEVRPLGREFGQILNDLYQTFRPPEQKSEIQPISSDHNIIYKSYITQQQKGHPYISKTYFQGKNLQLKEFALESFYAHFCQQYRLFYESFENLVEKNKMTESNKMLFTSFIRHYIQLNQENDAKLNILRFFYKMIIYAPIDKTQFLALHYLSKIIYTLDKKIKDFLIFYEGYFIYSTLDHKISSLFYDYFYEGSYIMKQDKEKLFQKFANTLEIQDKIDFPYGYINHVISDVGGFLFGPKGDGFGGGGYEKKFKNFDQEQFFEDNEVFFPKIFLPNEDGTQTQRKMVSYLEKGVHLLFLYDKDVRLSKQNYLQIYQAINKNIMTICKNLESDFEILQNSTQLFTLIYFNEMNLAFKTLPENLLEILDAVTLELVTELQSDLISDEGMDDITSRTEQFWIYGFRSNRRIIFLFFDGKLTLTQFSAEQKEAKNLYFSQVFI